jgi:hypothetical protein
MKQAMRGIACVPAGLVFAVPEHADVDTDFANELHTYGIYGQMDHNACLDSNDYSVHPASIGRRVLVRADLDRVQAFCDGDLLADHVRIWATHQTISDPDHVQAAKVLRGKRISTTRPIPEPDVAIRCLDDYDAALGVDLDGGVT